jgi:endonuclease VIII
VLEGETLNRVAAGLRIALVGKPTIRFDAHRLAGPTPCPGRVVEDVHSHRRRLDLRWDDGLILHTNARLGGAWHLYHADEPWRRPFRQMRVAVSVPGWVAVCFNAPVIETYRQFDRHRHPGFGRRGPDLAKPGADLARCVESMLDYDEPETPIAEVLLDQRVAGGLGNVFRSEVLWSCAVHPLARVGSLSEADIVQLVNAASRLLRTHLRLVPAPGPNVGGNLAVYGRCGQRCSRCADTVRVDEHGEQQLLLYWCPGCQTHHAPGDRRPDRDIDPHPAATRFLADLPWRRHAG